MPLTVSSPLRILLLSTPSTPPPELFRDNATHEVRTVYYNASIPIWRDELPTTPTSIESWEEEWTKEEAAEVIEAIGAWIICFRKPSTHDDLDTIRNLLTTVSRTIAHHTSSSYASPEPLLVALGMLATASPSLDLQSEEWEVLCRDAGGWEYVDGCIGMPTEGDEKGKVPTNEFGEKMGLARLKEVLEANEWEGNDGGGLGDVLDEDEKLDDGLALEEDLDEMDKTHVEGDTGELKESLLKVDAVKGQAGHTENEVDEYGGEDDDVQALESMMLRMQAVRDMGADMPEMERKQFAARAVREVMKTL